jgi:hypothetical protein
MSMKPVPMKTTYDSWTVLAPERTYRAHDKVLCICVCGTEREIAKNALTQGRSRSCGCRQVEQMREQVSTPEDADLVFDAEVKAGSRHGRWTALTVPFKDPNHRDRVAAVRCACGNEDVVVAHALLSRHSKSCGCLKRDKLRTRARVS